MPHKKKKPARKTYLGFKLNFKGQFNGKPISHWERMAEELVIHHIVRGMNKDNGNIVSAIAYRKFKEIVSRLDQPTYEKVVAERERCHAGLTLIMHDITRK